MQDEETFHTHANATLLAISNVLDPYDAAGTLEADLVDGVLTIKFPNKQQIVINKHSPTMQIWLSSPLSGGLHFTPQPDFKAWRLANNQTLHDVLKAEIQSLADITCILA